MKKKAVIIDKRVSNGYYAYCLELWLNNQYIDEECYGDMNYWGIPNEERRYDDALESLLKRNNLSKQDVEIRECGGFFQAPCWDDEEVEEE